MREGDIGLVRGLYALCPYIAGSLPPNRVRSPVQLIRATLRALRVYAAVRALFAISRIPKYLSLTSKL